MAITFVNNTQTGYGLIVSPDGKLQDAVTSGWVAGNSHTTLDKVPKGKLYQVGYINQNDSNYQGGYCWVSNVAADGVVTLTATVKNPAE
jgi:hypothetical protein